MVRQRGTRGTGGLDPRQSGSDGWLVITRKWSAFALQHSISTVSLGRAREKKEKGKQQNQFKYLDKRGKTTTE